MHHSRFVLPAGVALAFLLTVPTVADSATTQGPASAAPQGPAAPAAPGAITAEQAKPFLGDWTIAAESPQGPLAMALNLKAADGKISGQISSDMMPQQAITDISKSGESLVLRYSLDFNGNAVPVVITLTGGGEKLSVAFDFADGAFAMNGTATKKKA